MEEIIEKSSCWSCLDSASQGMPSSMGGSGVFYSYIIHYGSTFLLDLGEALTIEPVSDVFRSIKYGTKVTGIWGFQAGN